MFQVRRTLGDVPSSITLDHGDLLVMDGSAQSEHAHGTVPGLQGPRVILTYRWVTQHAASCPPAGVVGCVLPTCVQSLAEPGSRGLGIGENKWSSFFGVGHRHCCRRASRPAVYFPSGGCARWVGGRRWRLSRRRRSPKRASFYFPFDLLKGENYDFLSGVWFIFGVCC